MPLGSVRDAMHETRDRRAGCCGRFRSPRRRSTAMPAATRRATSGNSGHGHFSGLQIRQKGGHFSVADQSRFKRRRGNLPYHDAQGFTRQALTDRRYARRAASLECELQLASRADAAPR